MKKLLLGLCLSALSFTASAVPMDCFLPSWNPSQLLTQVTEIPFVASEIEKAIAVRPPPRSSWMIAQCYVHYDGRSRQGLEIRIFLLDVNVSTNNHEVPWEPG